MNYFTRQLPKYRSEGDNASESVSGGFDRDYTAEQRLLIAVMSSAALENDMDYFSGDVFKTHCYLLHVDSTEMAALIKKQLKAK